MATLREIMVQNIDETKAKVADMEAELAKMDAAADGFLSREVGELQAWIQSLANHAFSRGPFAQAPVASSNEVAAAATVSATELAAGS